MYGQFPMTSYIPDKQRFRACPVTILGCAISCRAGGPRTAERPTVEPRLVAILRVRVGPAYSMSLSGQRLVAELGEPGWSLLTSRHRPAID